MSNYLTKVSKIEEIGEMQYKYSLFDIELHSQRGETSIEPKFDLNIMKVFLATMGNLIGQFRFCDLLDLIENIPKAGFH